MNTSIHRWVLCVSFALLAAGHLLVPGGQVTPAFAEGEKAEIEAKPQPAGGAPAIAAPKPAPILLRRGAVAIPAGAKIAIIPIEGTIYGFTLDSLKRRVDRSVAAGVDVIVIELNTNGGTLDSALEISKYIRAQVERPDRTKVPTIAWINNKAYSAGILIASACGHIVMSPAAMTGDCAPISMLGASLAPTERAKILSPLLAEFRANADDNGYSYAAFHAMCVLEVKLYLVEHKNEKDPVTGQPMRHIVNQIDYQIMVDGKTRTSLKDEVAKVFGAGGDDPADVGSARRDVATDADRGQWTLVEEVHDGTTLLTLSTKQAVRYGLALEGNFARDADIQTFFSAASVVRVDETWSETMAGWLVSFPVRAGLVVIFLIASVVEMMTPGMGIAGAIAGVAIILLIVSPMLVGLAEVWHLILFFIGFLMLMAEIFITPGFGVLGIGGIIAMLGGIILAVVPTSGNGPVPLPAPEMMATLQQSALWTLFGLIVGSIGLFFLVKYYGQLPLFNRMVLHASQQAIVSANNPGGAAGRDPRGAVNDDDSEEAPMENPVMVAANQSIAGDDSMGVGAGITIGDEGRVTGELRPMGKAELRGRVVDVQSMTGWVDAGRRVRVVKMIGSRVLVEPV